jgi:pimeloyl-ACP methyl ester carboxylesterase
MFEFSVAGYFHDPAMAADLTPFRITGRTQQAVWESLGGFDFRSEVSALDVSAVVVHGEDDPIPIATAATLATLLRSPLVRIPDCGHVPYVEAPDRFFAALDPFLPKAGAP